MLTEAQVALRDEARQFAHDVVLPVANELDPQQAEIPQSLLDELAARGYFGIMIDKEHGGLGLGAFEYCLVTEELARAWMSVASVIARANGTGSMVPDLDERADILRRQAKGTFVTAGAFSEPEAGSDLANVQTRAERDGDDWILTGHKRWCGWALASDAIMVLARTGPDRRGDLDVFLVEKERGEFPEGMTGTTIPKIGYHGILSWNLELDGVRVPNSRVLVSADGKTGSGFSEFAKLINWGRLHTAARATGVARGALEDATLYARRRVQFGKEIGTFQGVKFKLADMATQVAAARSLWHDAARLEDSGQPSNQQCSMAKLFASEMAERVASDALQIYGGNGYTTENAIERYWRDARLTQIFEGTSEIQRTLIARSQLASVDHLV